MDTSKLIETKINKLDNDFSKLLNDNKIIIGQIEDLAINSMKNADKLFHNIKMYVRK